MTYLTHCISFLVGVALTMGVWCAVDGEPIPSQQEPQVVVIESMDDLIASYTNQGEMK